MHYCAITSLTLEASYFITFLKGNIFYAMINNIKYTCSKFIVTKLVIFFCLLKHELSSQNNVIVHLLLLFIAFWQIKHKKLNNKKREVVFISCDPLCYYILSLMDRHARKEFVWLQKVFVTWIRRNFHLDLCVLKWDYGT